MHQTAIDTEIFNAFCDGNDDAFKTVYIEYYARVLAMAKRYTTDIGAAQDVTAEAFLKLWKERSGLKSFRDIASFLSVNVRYKCIEIMRRSDVRHKHHAALLHILENEKETDFETELLRLELVKKIYAAADTLPPKLKEVFELTYKKGLKPAAIAKITGNSVQTVKNQKLKAIAILRKNFAHEPLILLILSGWIRQ